MRPPLWAALLLLGCQQTPAETPDDPVEVTIERPGQEVEAPPRADEQDELAGTSIRDVDELLQNIGSNRTLVLEAGEYDLDEASHEDGPFVRWEEVYDGQQLVIHDVHDLTITARGDATVLARPRYAFVIKLEQSKNVRIRQLTLGHSPGGSCTGGVIGAVASQHIEVSRSDLFGSGTVGVELEGVHDFTLADSTIRECTYGIAIVRDSQNVLFRNAQLLDNQQYDLVEVTNSEQVRFDRCTFRGNSMSKGYGFFFFRLDGSEVEITDSTFEDNDTDTLTNAPGRLRITP